MEEFSSFNGGVYFSDGWRLHFEVGATPWGGIGFAGGSFEKIIGLGTVCSHAPPHYGNPCPVLLPYFAIYHF